MSHFRQRVVLIHKLGQLAGTKELLDRGRNRLGVDQILRHQAFTFRQAQTLTNGSLYTDQTYTELVFSHFTHAPHTAVTEIVDIIHVTLAVTDIDQGLENVDYVVMSQRTFAGTFSTAHAAKELHPANGRQVVTLFREEQVVKQVLCRILGGRLSRTHHPIDLNQGLKRTTSRIDAQGIGHERTAIQIVRIEGLDICYASIQDAVNDFFSQLGITLNQHLASLGAVSYTHLRAHETDS